MKSTKRLISLPVLLTLLALLGSKAWAQQVNDLLLLQSLENPLEGTMVDVQARVYENWREKGVLKIRYQQEGDATGSFRTLYEFDKAGNLVRKEAGEKTQSIAYDSDGKLRLIFEPPTITTLLGAAFDMLRHASCDNATVLLYILDAIGTIGQAAKSPAVRQDLLRHVQLVQNESRTGHLIEPDQKRIRLSCEEVEMKLRTAESRPDLPVPNPA